MLNSQFLQLYMRIRSCLFSLGYNMLLHSWQKRIPTKPTWKVMKPIWALSTSLISHLYPIPIQLRLSTGVAHPMFRSLLLVYITQHQKWPNGSQNSSYLEYSTYRVRCLLHGETELSFHPIMHAETVNIMAVLNGLFELRSGVLMVN